MQCKVQCRYTCLNSPFPDGRYYISSWYVYKISVYKTILNKINKIQFTSAVLTGYNYCKNQPLTEDVYSRIVYNNNDQKLFSQLFRFYEF